MLLITDSICVSIIPSVGLITGIGNRIRLYYHDSNGQTVKTEVRLNFQSKIYSIKWIRTSQNQHYILAYGGREIAILKLIENGLKIIQCNEFRDWISSVNLYDKKNAEEKGILEFAVLTSHSEAFLVQTDNESGTWRNIDQSSCVEKSTLYCSRQLGERWDNTTVLGGTALGELIIWTIQSGSKLCQVHHRLSGHNGVIFSIDCCLEYSLITTTSDDRSVKVWTINNLCAERNWETCKVQPSKSMFGHSARIFQHKIITFDNTPFIVTIGEDAHVCVWTTAGLLLHRKPLSGGGTLWNLDYWQEKQILFVCGSDGNVHQIPLESIFSQNSFHTQIMPKISPSEATVQQHEYVSKLKIISSSILVGISNLNNVWFLITSEPSKWISIRKCRENVKITVLEGYENYIAVAGYKYVEIHKYRSSTKDFDLIFRKDVSNGLIRCLTFLNTNEFVVCDDGGNCDLISLRSECHFKFSLPLSKERWMTNALRYKNYLLIADRCGNLHLYVIAENDENIEFRHTLSHLHGTIGCSNITRDTRHFSELAFTTAGHDGTLKTIIIDENNLCLKICLTRRAPIVWIDKLIQSERYGDYIAGFNDCYFVFGHVDGQILFEHNCGGGHRFWDLLVDLTSSISKFYYIRNKQVHEVVFSIDVISKIYDIPRTNWHIRSCNVMKSISILDNALLLVSGGEDNLLKFSQLRNGQLSHVAEISLHVSSIKSIATFVEEHSVTPKRFLIFSAGGRAQICVSSISYCEKRGIGDTREITTFMLNYSDKTRKRMGKSQTIDFNPETRFMSLCAYKTHNSNDIYLVAGCSDGYIRKLVFLNDRITPMSSIFYGKCILNIHAFDWKEFQLLVTMATDGIICFWNLKQFDQTPKPFAQLSHHDSGVNSFSLMVDQRNEDSFYIASGGDDQSVTVSHFRLSNIESPVVNVIRQATFQNIHTAQVNGVQLESRRSSLYSVGVDQTINKLNLSDFTWEPMGHSTVSDAKGLLSISDAELFVYGNGIELINV